jgi:L-alanine-DL-glutamate epimerase-like enolase superfamily enzyme
MQCLREITMSLIRQERGKLMNDTLTQAAEQIGAARGVTITDVQTLRFKYQSCVGRDDEGHGHPAPPHTKTQTITRVRTSLGIDGYYVGGSPENAAVTKRMIVGMDPLLREPIWHKLQQVQRIETAAMLDRHLAAIDCALWDFAGKLTGLPVHKLLGGSRTRVPAYASTMCGDDIPGGLGSPEDYANFAVQCVAQGYRAYKLHTWMSPYGPDLKRDIAACRAVREAVGPDITLVLDPHHHYSRAEALYLGRALEELDFAWMEEPMDEHSISSYVWLTENLQKLQICGPETAEGQFYTRAEWIVRGAADLSRVGISDVGGISPAMKVVHLCEAFHMRCEVHGGGSANLQVLGAMGIPGEMYEKGLLHPHVDFEAEKPWLKTPIDLIDADGTVAIPQGPGLGDDLDWDYITDNTVSDWA